MIIKKREKPIIIEKLEALERRLSKTHKKYPFVKGYLGRKKAGFKGELALDYYLNFLPNEKYLIFQDLRLFDGNSHFQLDLLLISQNFFLIIEVKNYSGTLIFDPKFNQLIRISEDGKEKAFSDPLLQIKRHSTQLRNWLETNNLPLAPIESLVVISNPETIIKATSKHDYVSQKVLHTAFLTSRVESLENNRKDEVLTTKEVKKISQQILKKHHAINTDILAKYQLSENDIISGVQCPKCQYNPMKNRKGGWFCQACKTTSKEAHISAIRDYLLLLGPSITNSEARHFLHISSSSVVKRLLTSMNLPHTGENKGRRYHQPEDQFRK
ncbi:nuclease-related domain-containing protein [Bacillus sp. DJP31]|uniref:nuclease-related domain-containing protein n=1 Tax=Bacillus sp. DJP31 TaxID=3409789 RepID=UPI003BB505CD